MVKTMDECIPLDEGRRMSSIDNLFVQEKNEMEDQSFDLNLILPGAERFPEKKIPRFLKDL